MNLPVKDIAKKSGQTVKPDFEDLYFAVREQEKKIYTDNQLRLLPDFNTFSKEWEIRKRSSNRLIGYLKKKRCHLKILEVGCGNGWLSAKLAAIPNTKVTGLDINKVEITQAKRVFKKDNLEFVYDSFNENTFDNDRFDVIVFAASLQYFSSVVNVLSQALAGINPNGEIHIIDTPFYNLRDAGKAHERCRNYYMEMGLPKMADHYFHHSISEFWGFKYRVLFNPADLLNRVFKKDPFYWIAVNK